MGMQLHAFAKLCVSQNAFGELHSAALVRLHVAWHEAKVADPGATVVVFAKALHDTLASVDYILTSSPLESIAELMMIKDAPVLLSGATSAPPSRRHAIES